MNFRPLFIFILLLVGFAGRAQDFHYPSIPDSIRNREERIHYMALHFWEYSDVNNMNLYSHPKWMLDYLYLLRNMEREKVREALDIFMARICHNDEALEMTMFVLDECLRNASSPHYNEELYLQVLDAVLASEADTLMKLKPKSQREVLLRNRIGNVAENFCFVNCRGDTQCLYQIKSPWLLLFFNNPECSLCEEAEQKILESEQLIAMQQKGKLKILAIALDTDERVWLGKKYPKDWIAGRDKEHVIYAQKLYDIQRLPCFYLLDEEKRVVIKEADVNDILGQLAEGVYNVNE